MNTVRKKTVLRLAHKLYSMDCKKMGSFKHKIVSLLKKTLVNYSRPIHAKNVFLKVKK